MIFNEKLVISFLFLMIIIIRKQLLYTKYKDLFIKSLNVITNSNLYRSTLNDIASSCKLSTVQSFSHP
jgi:hypothetical protein